MHDPRPRLRASVTQPRGLLVLRTEGAEFDVEEDGFANEVSPIGSDLCPRRSMIRIVVRPRGTRADRLMTKAVLTGEVRMNHDAAGQGDVLQQVTLTETVLNAMFDFYRPIVRSRARETRQ